MICFMIYSTTITKREIKSKNYHQSHSQMGGGRPRWGVVTLSTLFSIEPFPSRRCDPLFPLYRYRWSYSLAIEKKIILLKSDAITVLYWLLYVCYETFNKVFLPKCLLRLCLNRYRIKENKRKKFGLPFPLFEWLYHLIDIMIYS